MFHLDIQDDNDDVFILDKPTLVITREIGYAAFHNAVWHPSKETDDSDVILLQIYYRICVPIIILI